MQNLILHKKCFNCCKIKPISEFTKDAQKPDGFRADCKECRYNKKNEKIEDGFKRCRGKHGCGEIKLISCFYLKEDGNYNTNCDECCKKFRIGYAIENKQKISETNKKLRQKYTEQNLLLDPYENNEKKKCWACQELKNRNCFYKDGSKKDGLGTACIECSKINNKNERIKNLEKRQESDKFYKKKNRDRYNQNFNQKYASDILFKIKTNLRNRTRLAIKNNQKVGSVISDLGCSILELKRHLEKQFYSNSKTGEMMTWDNYGLHGWHIDHIVPLASFNLENREEFLKACNYTNLQPLWAKENLQKGAK